MALPRTTDARRRFLLLGVSTAGLALTAPGALAQGPKRPYEVIDPAQAVDVPAGKVEVLEFFFYGCPHCYNLQGPLKEWLKGAPKDIEFRRVPTVFRDSWIPMARAYYALDALGAVEKAHHDLFTEIHEKNNEKLLTDKAAFLDWAAKKGVDRAKLQGAYESFAVDGRTKRAVQMTKDYRISGTPSMVIQGKYLTAPSMVLNPDNSVNYARFNKVLDELIAMARVEAAGKGGAPKGAPAKKG
jgi:thiol:disulfide interchange protein DsbA